MGLTDRIHKFLDRGESPDRDPNSPVEIAVVPLIQGPMLVHALCEEGYSAYLVEGISIRTDIRNEGRIFVKRGEAGAALVLLDQIR